VQQPKEIVCFYTDLGRPYLPLLKRMTDTAKSVMPYCKTTLLTTTLTEELGSLFDNNVQINLKCDATDVCFVKSRAMITWQAQLKEPCVFVDPDIVFQNPIPAIDADVGLLRTRKSAHPINSSFVMAAPGHHEFWKKYGNVVASLPTPLRSWWCDQLAFSVMMGSLIEAGKSVDAFGAKVALIPFEQACAEPERALPGAWALHYKGSRKGEGWSQFYSRPPLAEGEIRNYHE
jgi:hypothetical protein